MNRVNIIIIILAVVTCISCSTSSQSILVQNIKPDSYINVLSDSSFFSELRCLTMYKNQIFVSDSKRDQIFVMDTNMKLVDIIGNTNTNDNLYRISDFAISDDTLLVKEGGGNRYQLFTLTGDYVKSIPIHDNFSDYSHRFLFKNNLLTLCAKGDSALLTASIYDVDQQFFFGKRYDFNNIQQNHIRNQRFILDNDKSIYCISDNMPFIEQYDRCGKLITKYDYSTLDCINNEIKYIFQKNIKENSYNILVYDCFLNNNSIYILYVSKVGGFQTNKILEFNIEPNISPVRLLVLPNEVYKSICIYNHNLYAFDYLTRSLQRFKI